MVKPAEVTQVLAHGRFHIGLMVYTAVMVIVTDFLTGVLSAIILHAVLYRFLEARKTAPVEVEPLLATVRVDEPAPHWQPRNEERTVGW
jgi:MFS superfamily sulfate permease-like transporter